RSVIGGQTDEKEPPHMQKGEERYSAVVSWLEEKMSRSSKEIVLGVLLPGGLVVGHEMSPFNNGRR
ncbi:Hypothetical predicted protein, partial [Podarcis lilfordi]